MRVCINAVSDARLSRGKDNSWERLKEINGFVFGGHETWAGNITLNKMVMLSSARCAGALSSLESHCSMSRINNFLSNVTNSTPCDHHAPGWYHLLFVFRHAQKISTLLLSLFIDQIFWHFSLSFCPLLSGAINFQPRARPTFFLYVRALSLPGF